MNLRSLLPVFAAVGLLRGADSRLVEIRQVYVLPMSGGLDQYLANRLTQNGRYVVVTDPAKADALLTDTVGIAFEDKYKELYPPPPPPAPPEGSKDAKDSKKDDKSVMAMLNAGGMPNRTSAFSRGKGNVFLVDRASRAVIWSIYMPPRNRSTSEMDKTADRIVDKMDDAVEKYEKALKKGAVAMSAPVKPAPAPVAAPVPVAAPAPAAPAKPAAPAPAPTPAPAK